MSRAAAASSAVINQTTKTPPLLFKLHRVESELLPSQNKSGFSIGENFYLKERSPMQTKSAPQTAILNRNDVVEDNIPNIDRKQNELVLEWLMKKCDTDDAAAAGVFLKTPPPPPKRPDNLKVIRVDKSRSPRPKAYRPEVLDDNEDDLRRTYNQIKRARSPMVVKTTVLPRVDDEGDDTDNEKRDLKDLVNGLLRSENILPENGNLKIPEIQTN
jgi:hypothetical protein